MLCRGDMVSLCDALVGEIGVEKRTLCAEAQQIDDEKRQENPDGIVVSFPHFHPVATHTMGFLFVFKAIPVPELTLGK